MVKINIVVEVTDSDPGTVRTALREARYATVGRFTARKDTPHNPGQEYHAHADVGKGREVAWTVTGARQHPSKFPADDRIPRDAKQAVADVLGVDVSLLEAFTTSEAVDNVGPFYLRKKRTKSDILLEMLRKT
jgi:hypothetical protein